MTTDSKSSARGDMYVAILLLRATHDDASPDTFAEEIVLLAAPDEDAAKANASAWGEEQSTSYVSATGVTVVWSLWCVVDVHLVESMLPGESIYTRFFEDIGAYARFDTLARGVSTSPPLPNGSAPTSEPSDNPPQPLNPERARKRRASRHRG